MNAVNWIDSRKFTDDLIKKGWRTPDTYSNWFAFPEKTTSAVYLFLVHDINKTFDKAFVGYVGMARNLVNRWACHPVLMKLNKIDNLWPMRWFLPLPCEELRSLERQLINELDPIWNVIGRSRDIKRLH